MYMIKAGIVLDCVWLHNLGTTFTCSYKNNTLAFKDIGVHKLLIGEQEILQVTFICTVKLFSLVKNNKIHKGFFLCYLLFVVSHVN